MKRHVTNNQAVFNPQFYKSFIGALGAFFEQECPQLGGFRTRQVLVKTINDMVLQFFPDDLHQTRGIGEEIEQLQRKGHALNEIAILVRFTVAVV